MTIPGKPKVLANIKCKTVPNRIIILLINGRC